MPLRFHAKMLRFFPELLQALQSIYESDLLSVFLRDTSLRSLLYVKWRQRLGLKFESMRGDGPKQRPRFLKFLD